MVLKLLIDSLTNKTGAHFDFKHLCSKLEVIEKSVAEQKQSFLIKLKNKKSRIKIMKTKPKMSKEGFSIACL